MAKGLASSPVARASALLDFLPDRLAVVAAPAGCALTAEALTKLSAPEAVAQSEKVAAMLAEGATMGVDESQAAAETESATNPMNTTRQAAQIVATEAGPKPLLPNPFTSMVYNLTVDASIGRALKCLLDQWYPPPFTSEESIDSLLLEVDAKSVARANNISALEALAKANATAADSFSLWTASNVKKTAEFSLIAAEASDAAENASAMALLVVADAAKLAGDAAADYIAILTNATSEWLEKSNQAEISKSSENATAMEAANISSNTTPTEVMHRELEQEEVAAWSLANSTRDSHIAAQAKAAALAAEARAAATTLAKARADAAAAVIENEIALAANATAAETWKEAAAVKQRAIQAALVKKAQEDHTLGIAEVQGAFGDPLSKGTATMVSILDQLGIGLRGEDVFVDIGSGAGQLALQIYLTTSVGLTIGLEPSLPRSRLSAIASQAASGLGSVLYGVGVDLNIYAMPISIASPLQQWTHVGQGPMQSIAVWGNEIYGVGMDNCVYHQALSSLNVETDWIAAAAGPVKSLALDGVFIYAVGVDYQIWRQPLSKMTTSTSWEPCGGGFVASIAIDSSTDTIYGVGGGGEVYKQQLSSMTTESVWIQVSKGQVEAIGVYGDTIFGVAVDSRVWRQPLSTMSIYTDWTLCTQGNVLSVAVSGQGPLKPFTTRRALEFDHGDLLVVDRWANATIVHLSSLRFSTALMLALGWEISGRLSPGTIVLSQQEFPGCYPSLVMVHVLSVATLWSPGGAALYTYLVVPTPGTQQPAWLLKGASVASDRLAAEIRVAASTAERKASSTIALAADSREVSSISMAPLGRAPLDVTTSTTELIINSGNSDAAFDAQAGSFGAIDILRAGSENSDDHSETTKEVIASEINLHLQDEASASRRSSAAVKSASAESDDPANTFSHVQATAQISNVSSEGEVIHPPFEVKPTSERTDEEVETHAERLISAVVENSEEAVQSTSFTESAAVVRAALADAFRAEFEPLWLAAAKRAWPNQSVGTASLQRLLAGSLLALHRRIKFLDVANRTPAANVVAAVDYLAGGILNEGTLGGDEFGAVGCAWDALAVRAKLEQGVAEASAATIASAEAEVVATPQSGASPVDVSPQVITVLSHESTTSLAFADSYSRDSRLSMNAIVERFDDLHATDASGRNLAWFAASSPDVDVASRSLSVLLAAVWTRGGNVGDHTLAAFVETPDVNGLRPLDAAIRWGHPVAARLLIRARASVELADKHGRRPLHYAALHSRADMAQVLLEHRASLEAQDHSGDVPWKLAPLKNLFLLRLLGNPGVNIDEGEIPSQAIGAS